MQTRFPEVGPKSKALCPEMQSVWNNNGVSRAWDLLGEVSVGPGEVRVG